MIEGRLEAGMAALVGLPHGERIPQQLPTGPNAARLLEPDSPMRGFRTWIAFHLPSFDLEWMPMRSGCLPTTFTPEV